MPLRRVGEVAEVGELRGEGAAERRGAEGRVARLPRLPSCEERVPLSDVGRGEGGEVGQRGQLRRQRAADRRVIEPSVVSIGSVVSTVGIVPLSFIGVGFPSRREVRRESLPSCVGSVPATPSSCSSRVPSDASSPTSPETVPDSPFPRMTSEATAPPASHPTPYHSHTGAGPSQPDRSAQPAPPVATYSARSASTSRLRLPPMAPPPSSSRRAAGVSSQPLALCRQPRPRQAALALGAAHAAEAAHQGSAPRRSARSSSARRSADSRTPRW